MAGVVLLIWTRPRSPMQHVALLQSLSPKGLPVPPVIWKIFLLPGLGLRSLESYLTWWQTKGCYWSGTGVPGMLRPLSTELCLSRIFFPYNTLQAPSGISCYDLVSIQGFTLVELWMFDYIFSFCLRDLLIPVEDYWFLRFYFFKLIRLAFLTLFYY